MLSNKIILDLAYLCKLSYLDQEEIKQIFNNNTHEYKHLIENSTDFPLLIENNKDDCEVYILKYNNNLIIAFRGTESLQDMISDIKIARKDLVLKNTCLKPLVHTGFYDQLDSVNNTIERNIKMFKESTPEGSLIITGHSLGGAVATIASLKYATEFELPTYCVTFGSPRVGDAIFCNLFNEKIASSIRIVNDDDPIPLVPLPFRYSHVDGVKWIYDNKILSKTEQCCKWFRFIGIFFLSCSTCCLKSAFDDHTMDSYILDLNNLEEFQNLECLVENNRI